MVGVCRLVRRLAVVVLAMDDRGNEVRVEECRDKQLVRVSLSLSLRATRCRRNCRLARTRSCPHMHASGLRRCADSLSASTVNLIDLPPNWTQASFLTVVEKKVCSCADLRKCVLEQSGRRCRACEGCCACLHGEWKPKARHPLPQCETRNIHKRFTSAQNASEDKGMHGLFKKTCAIHVLL